MKRVAIAATLAAAIVGLFHTTTGGVLAQILKGDRIEIPATPASLACDLSDPGAYIEGDLDTGISRTCSDDELAIVVGQDAGSSIARTFLFNRYGFSPPTVTFAQLSPVAPDGSNAYCSDCNESSPCTAGGTGAHAKRTNGAWECSGGGGGAGFPLTTNTVIANDDVLVQFGTGADASIQWENLATDLTLTSSAGMTFDRNVGSVFTFEDGVGNAAIDLDSDGITMRNGYTRITAAADPTPALGFVSTTAGALSVIPGESIQSWTNGFVRWVVGANQHFFRPPPAAGSSEDMLDFSFAPSSMNGLDTQRALFLDIANTTHTGASNLLLALDVDAITGSANATEYAIRVGTGWDIGLSLPDDTPIQLGATADASILWDNGNGELDITTSLLHETAPFIWTTLGTGSFDGWFVDDTAGTTIFNLDSTPGTQGFFQVRGDLDTMTGGGAMLRLRPSTFPALASGTFSWLFIEGNSVNHTGGTIVGIEFQNSTADAQANEYGIRFPANGYDQELKWSGVLNLQGTNVTDSVSIDMGADYVFGSPPNAGVGGDLATLTATLNAMNGGDTIRGFGIDLTNANHTVGTNTLIGLEVSGITGDAEADEYGIRVGTDWDFPLVLQSDTNGQQLIEFQSTTGGNTGYGFGRGGNANNGVLAFGNGSPQVLILDMDVSRTVFGNNWEVYWGTVSSATGDTGIVGNSSNDTFEIQTASLTRFTFQDPPAAASSGDLSTWTWAATAMDGADDVVGFALDLTNANHTGSGNTLSGLELTIDTPDAEATEAAIRFTGGWDRDLIKAGAITAEVSNGQSFRVYGPNNDIIAVFGHNQARTLLIDGSLTSSGDLAHFEVSTGGALAGSQDAFILRIGGGFTDGAHTGTGNFVNALEVSAITSPDTNAIHAALNVNAGWDALIMGEAAAGGWAAADNPAANHIVEFYDESADRGAGTAAADCAKIFRLSDGTEVVGTVLVTDGGCP